LTRRVILNTAVRSVIVMYTPEDCSADFRRRILRVSAIQGRGVVRIIVNPCRIGAVVTAAATAVAAAAAAAVVAKRH
jgi:hypothetical protein